MSAYKRTTNRPEMIEKAKLKFLFLLIDKAFVIKRMLRDPCYFFELGGQHLVKQQSAPGRTVGIQRPDCWSLSCLL